ncbi:hypothetical protein ABZP36_006185 [Zizania latifolia]
MAEWSSGLLECGGDCGICCMTLWCPCITFGRVAEIVDRGATSCGASGALYALLGCLTGTIGCQWIYSCTYRRKMRAQELVDRGYDPKLGWDLNVQRGSSAASAANFAAILAVADAACAAGAAAMHQQMFR